MAQVYFSKLNISSKIYDVYNDPEVLQQILNKVFESVDPHSIVLEEELINAKTPDNSEYFENEAEEEHLSEITRLTKYKFIELIKDSENRNITGRLVKIYSDNRENYDESNDTISVVSADDCATSCTFYFDVNKEQIAFITRNRIGHKKFNLVFKLLLEACVRDISFELSLEKNIEDFKEKISKLKRISSLNMTIVPPNANNKEMSELLDSEELNELKETKATKLKKNYTVSKKSKEGLNSESKVFNRMFLFIQNGYGNSSISGQDAYNSEKTLFSDDDSPYKEFIPDIEKESISAFKEHTRSFVNTLVAKKQELFLRSKNLKNKE